MEATTHLGDVDRNLEAVAWKVDSDMFTSVCEYSLHDALILYEDEVSKAQRVMN